jgi:hypothetical protein
VAAPELVARRPLDLLLRLASLSKQSQEPLDPSEAIRDLLAQLEPPNIPDFYYRSGIGPIAAL